MNEEYGRKAMSWYRELLEAEVGKLQKENELLKQELLDKKHSQRKKIEYAGADFILIATEKGLIVKKNEPNNGEGELFKWEEIKKLFL